MPIQLSIAVRNARLDQVEVIIGVSAVLRIRSGAQPADCATADSGTVLASMTLPVDWAAAAGAGAKAKSGVWSDASADAAGTAGHFRMYESTGVTCGLQGTCGQGSGDLSLDNTNIAVGQTITINTFTLTDGNA